MIEEYMSIVAEIF